MNNRKTAGRIQLVLTILILLFLALWISTLTLFSFGSSVYQYGSGILFFGILFYFMMGGMYYVEVEQDNGMVHFKFYNSFPFSREFKMYQIPQSAFVKIELSGLKWFRRKMTLFQTTSNQLSKYPPILITAFTQKDIDALNHFLNGLSDN